MFKDWKFLLIISLVAVIVLLILFWPSKQPDQDTSEAFKSEIERLKVEKAENRLKVERIVETSKARVQSDSVKLALKDEEISRLKKRYSAAVSKIPPKVIEEHPEVGEALAAADSVNQALTQQNDTLKASVAFHRKSFDDLVKIHIDSERVNEEIQTAYATRLDEEQKLNERTFKKLTFWKKAGQAAIVVVVVETAILILQ